MKRNNYIMYENETGLIRQLASFPSLIPTEILEEDDLTVVSVNFYNDVTGCYYDPLTGKFYEDAEKTVEISDPANYKKPVPEPVEDMHTLEATASAE